MQKRQAHYITFEDLLSADR
uniref:Uncharacterized protein n=1 Tax=Arundo donax TaxID=35708 RepID=A0A0A9H794_ARUDO